MRVGIRLNVKARIIDIFTYWGNVGLSLGLVSESKIG